MTPIILFVASLFLQIGSVQLQTSVVPDTVYAGQQVNYDAITLVDDVARARLRANPLFTPPEVAGATIYDFPFDTASTSDVMVNGARFRRFVYHRALFPLTPGTYNVPPGTLQYTLPESEGNYGVSQSFTDHSVPTSFVALALPFAGRPIGFGGAVGEFRDTLVTDGSPARVGDTFTITVRITGLGNLKLLPRPPLQIPWATVVTGGERVLWDSSGTYVRGSKEFDWILTPQVAGDLSLPSVRYDFFNPTTHRYEAVATASVPLTVAPATTTTAEPIRAPRDSIGDTPFPVVERWARANPLVVGIGASMVVVILIGIFAYSERGDSSADEE